MVSARGTQRPVRIAIILDNSRHQPHLDSPLLDLPHVQTLGTVRKNATILSSDCAKRGSDPKPLKILLVIANAAGPSRHPPYPPSLGARRPRHSVDGLPRLPQPYPEVPNSRFTGLSRSTFRQTVL
eukprot:scaffold645373_cov32-Prasinocladus_malaysianus.AAC.1